MTKHLMTAPAEGEAPPAQNPHHDRRWLILAVLGLAQLMVVLDATVVNIALPTAQRALSFSNADRQWIVTGYALSFGSLLLLGGRLSDILGRKRALMIGLAGFAAASALGGFSTSFTMLLFARVLQGSFGALLAPAALAMLTTTFTDPSERGRAFGIYGAISGGGGALGLLLGGKRAEVGCGVIPAVIARLELEQRTRERVPQSHRQRPGDRHYADGLPVEEGETVDAKRLERRIQRRLRAQRELGDDTPAAAAAAFDRPE